MEAGLPRAELNENGDGAVRLRSRRREESIRNLALHHHAPRPKRRRVLERLDDERRRDVVREIGDELRGCWRELVDIDRERVVPDQRDVRPLAERFAQDRLERAVDLDRMDEATRDRRGSA